MTVPLYNNCQLIEAGGNALAAKVDSGTTEIDVPPGSVPIAKEVDFTGTPSTTATSLTLACNHLFWQGFGQPESLQVKGIALRAAG